MATLSGKIFKTLTVKPLAGNFFYELHTAKGISVTLNEIKKILTKISTALKIEHKIEHRWTPSKL